MFAADGRSFDLLSRILLGDLCFIDGREDDQARAEEHLRTFGKLGVVGPFEAVFGGNGRYTDEVASVHAEVFHRLGYFTAVEPVAARDWAEFATSLRTQFEEGDHRRSEVDAMIGPPSLAIGTVSCYASPVPSDSWVFFDFAREQVMQYQAGEGTYKDLEWCNDPLLRDIRVPAPTFDEGLILPLYGRVRRWGTGWWTREGAPSSAPEGVPEALRLIDAADPSQSLRQPPAVGYRPA